MIANIIPYQPLQLVPPPEVEKPKELYEFQKDCIASIYRLIKTNIHRILLVAPCATGKTTMSGYIIKDATQKAKKTMRCMFLVSLNCLIDQAAEAFEELGVSCSVLQGDREFDKNTSVVIASVQTIRSRLKKQSLDELIGKIGLIFVDECHWLAYDKTYSEIHDHYLPTGTIFIGLTATPWRTSMKQYLGEWFDEVVAAPSPPELVKMGKLVPCRIYGFGKTFDFSKLDIGADGDYQINQVEAQATTKASLDCVVREYLRLAKDRRAAAFCVSVEHAKKLYETFLAAGVRAEYIDGTTPHSDRKAMFARLDAGETMVLCSVGTLTAGWNSRPTSCVIVARPTRSKSLFFQMAGRGGRTYPGKSDYLILDFGNNVVRHGSPMGTHDIDIGPKTSRRKPTESHKECYNCGSVISVWLRVCPECGAEFKVEKTKAEEDENLLDAQLVEIIVAEDRPKVKFFRDKKKECFKNWVHPKIATEAFQAEYGYIPPRD